MTIFKRIWQSKIMGLLWISVVVVAWVFRATVVVTPLMLLAAAFMVAELISILKAKR